MYVLVVVAVPDDALVKIHRVTSLSQPVPASDTR